MRSCRTGYIQMMQWYQDILVKTIVPSLIKPQNYTETHRTVCAQGATQEFPLPRWEGIKGRVFKTISIITHTPALSHPREREDLLSYYFSAFLWLFYGHIRKSLYLELK
jgi:hypothetical protein